MDSLDGVVIPEGTYPALGQSVKVLVANNGPDMQHLPGGQKLEGYVVSETKRTAQGRIKPPPRRMTKRKQRQK